MKPQVFGSAIGDYIRVHIRMSPDVASFWFDDGDQSRLNNPPLSFFIKSEWQQVKPF